MIMSRSVLMTLKSDLQGSPSIAEADVVDSSSNSSSSSMVSMVAEAEAAP
jgi:hypothetical protein